MRVAGRAGGIRGLLSIPIGRRLTPPRQISTSWPPRDTRLARVNWARAMGGGLDGDSYPGRRAHPAVEEKRPASRSSVLGTGTLACHRCDAPIAPAAQPLLLTDRLTCPYCAAEGPARDFLSFAVPTRPARVVVRVAMHLVPGA